MITGNETDYPVVEIEEGVGVAASDERGLTIRQHFAACINANVKCSGG